MTGERGQLLPDALTESARPRKRASVATEELDGEAVVYAEDTGSVHVLNTSAALVWQLLDGQSSVAELATELSEVFDTPADAIRADILSVVHSFGFLGLLDGIDGVEAADAADTEQDPVTAMPSSSGQDLRFLPEPPHG